MDGIPPARQETRPARSSFRPVWPSPGDWSSIGSCRRRGDSPTLSVAVSLEGWIFMVGLRVFDVGALVVWLVWFFRLRDDDDDDGDDYRRGPGDAPEPEEPCGGGGLRLPLPVSQPRHARLRDHAGDRTGPPAPHRRAPHPVPARAPVKRSPHS